MQIVRIISVILFSVVLSSANAQSVIDDCINRDSVKTAKKIKDLGKQLNTKLTDRYYTTKYDTNFVERPKEKWLLRFMVNQMGNYIHAKGTVNGIYSKYDLHTKSNTTLALEVNYCDIAASLSLNPSKISGSYDDYEFNFEYHGRQVSIDLNYLRATSLAGDMRMDHTDIDHLNKDGLRMNEFNLTAYYTFNHRRFSFPAVFYQNYYQLRSAGSWLAGISFKAGSLKTTDNLKARSPQAPDVHLQFVDAALGGGYGYNFVFGKRSQWQFHLSALPSVVLYKHNRLTVNNSEKKDHGLAFNMIFNERAAMVYQFSPRYFAGATLVMSNSVFDNDRVMVNQNKWLARAFLGMRLGK